MKQKHPILLLSALLLLPMVLTQGAVVIRDWQFNDTNGTNLSAANSTGAESGSWNATSAQTQNGVLNFGYTNHYKWRAVDDASGSTAFRTFTFDTTLTTAAYTTYTFEIVFSSWDLRESWRAPASAEGKGIGFQILESSGDNAQIGFETRGTNGFRAFSQGTGASFTEVGGNEFDNNLNRLSTTGGILRLTGDLTTGAWTASANDGQGGAFQIIVSGSGIMDISAFGFYSKSPTVGSWGGAGAPDNAGTAGDYFAYRQHDPVGRCHSGAVHNRPVAWCLGAWPWHLPPPAGLTADKATHNNPVGNPVFWIEWPKLNFLSI